MRRVGPRAVCFDGCLRWLLALIPSSTFNRIWNELGAIAGREIVSHDEFLRVEGTDGQVLSLSANLDQFAQGANGSRRKTPPS